MKNYQNFYSKLTVFVILLITLNPLFSQNLMTQNPNGIFDLSTSGRLPFQTTIGAGYGWDSNLSTDANEDASSSVYANIAISKALSGNSRTVSSFGLGLTASHFFDDYVGKDEEIEIGVTASLNFAHKITRRLTFTNVTTLSYGREPFFLDASNVNTTNLENTAFLQGGATRRVGNYFYGVTTLGLAYSWTPRFFTTINANISGILYEDANNTDDEDRVNYSVTLGGGFNSATNERLTYTFAYTPQISLLDSNAVGDSQSHTFTVGVLYKYSQYLSLFANVGATYRNVDGGDSFLRPAGSLGLTYLPAQFTVFNLGINLANTDNELGVFSNRYGVSIFSSLSHRFNERTTLVLNGIVTPSSLEEAVIDGQGDIDELSLSAGVALNYLLFSNVSANVGYRFTKFTSDDSDREYDRHSFNAGISTSF